MNTIEKRFYHIKGMPKAEEADWQTNENYVEADVYYTKGGYSYFTYKNTPRGYFMSVHKIGRYTSDGVAMESHTLFSGDGMKRLIKETTRSSKSAEQYAHDVYKAEIEDFLSQVYPGLELELEEVA